MKYLVVAALLLAFAGCTSSDSDDRQADKERQARQEREMERLAQEQAAAARSQASEPAVAEQAPEEPSEPEEPAKPAMIPSYNLHSFTGTTVAKACLCREKTECGMTFWACGDGVVYACLQNVRYSISETRETDDNANICE